MIEVSTDRIRLQGLVRLQAASALQAALLPENGDIHLYVKDPGTSKLYYRDDAGVEHEVAIVGGTIDHGALTGLGDDDHTQYVLRSILTTNGDVFTRSAGAIARLGIGSTGEVLTVVGGAPAWAASTGGGATIVVEELDGAPSVAADTIKFDQGDGFSVIDNSDGSVTVKHSGGGGGAVYTEAGPSSVVAAPPTTSWSWDNQGAASVIEGTAFNTNTLALASGAGSGLHVRYRTAPSAPYVITALFHAHGKWGVNFLRFGLLFRQSSDGKIAHIAQRMEASAGVLGVAKYTTSTSFSADYTTVTLGDHSRFIWFRIADNNTNRISSYSWNGVDFIQLHSVGRTDFLTANQVGWFIQTEAGASDLSVNLVSWVVT